MDVKSLIPDRSAARMAAAGALMASGALAMPLAFLRLGGSAVPLYGSAELVTMPVLCLLCLSFTALFPERLKGFFADRRMAVPAAGTALFLLSALGGFIAGHLTADALFTGLFYPSAALAGAALAPEMKKLLPGFAAAFSALLLWSGFFSEHFTGLAGNWNWTQGLIAALLPGWVLLCGTARPLRWAAVLLAGFFLLMWRLYPAEFSRSALVSVLIAPAVIAAADRLPEKVFDRLFVAGALLFAVAFALLLTVADLPDTRFQIWKGAWGVILSRPLTGVGAGQLAEHIRRFLGDGFYFTEFPAIHIAHAHNGFLQLFAEYGIAGAVFFFSAAYGVLCRRPEERSVCFARWVFVFLLVCGQFDMHCAVLPGGLFFALCAGVVLAPAGHEEWVAGRFCRRALTVAGAMLMIAGIAQAHAGFRASLLLRRGELAQRAGDDLTAVKCFAESMEWKLSAPAVYRAAELELTRFRRPEEAMYLLRRMEKSLALKNYLHARRLRGMAAYETGDPRSAAEEFSQESRNAPYSVINANFNRIVLRRISAPPEAVAAADALFLDLCRRRGIAPEAAGRFSAAEDDAAFAPRWREEFWK